MDLLTDIHRPSKQGDQLLLQLHFVEQASTSFKVDKQIDVAVAARVASRDRPVGP